MVLHKRTGNLQLAFTSEYQASSKLPSQNVNHTNEPRESGIPQNETQPRLYWLLPLPNHQRPAKNTNTTTEIVSHESTTVKAGHCELTMVSVMIRTLFFEARETYLPVFQQH